MPTPRFTFTKFNDPGHGWLMVKISKLEQLGIADKISSCSYRMNDVAFLEEDCDASLFYKAMKQSGLTRGVDYEVVQRHTNNYSDIRNYRHYHYDVKVEA